jgi:hypothetical protein
MIVLVNNRACAYKLLGRHLDLHVAVHIRQSLLRKLNHLPLPTHGFARLES